jgi:hypothetical protein
MSEVRALGNACRDVHRNSLPPTCNAAIAQ